MSTTRSRNAARPGPLTERSFRKAVRALSGSDPDLARIVDRFGPPPLWARDPGFGTLLYTILEQQVSLASARATYRKLNDRVPSLTPSAFLRLGDGELKRIGFSRQKMRYARLLSREILGGFDLEALEKESPARARETLLGLTGIGPWTADVYLLSALRHPDIWPVGDLALASAVQRVKRLRGRPDPERLERIGERWRPWRAVAARLLWHFYLSS